MIARTWRGWVRTEDRAVYVDYVERTGMAQSRQTPGNLSAQVLARDLDDGRTEIMTVSFWTSLDAVRGFAGADVGAAVFYAEDDRWLVDREETVSHYEVYEAD
jgi:heme-degrading monooxygenase HmoA